MHEVHSVRSRWSIHVDKDASEIVRKVKTTLEMVFVNEVGRKTPRWRVHDVISRSDVYDLRRDTVAGLDRE